MNDRPSVREIVDQLARADADYAIETQSYGMPPSAETASACARWQGQLDGLGPESVEDLEAIAAEGHPLQAGVADARAKKIRKAMAVARFEADHARDPVTAYVTALELGELEWLPRLGGEPVPVLVAVYERALDAIDRSEHEWRNAEADLRPLLVLVNWLLGAPRGYRGEVPDLLTRLIEAPGWIGSIAFARTLCAREPPPGIRARFADLPVERRRRIAWDLRYVDERVRPRGARLLVDDSDAVVANAARAMIPKP